MVYQKNFPQQRAPFFWAIVSSHLAATAPDATELDKRIFGALAYRLISKAASDAIETSSHMEQDLEMGGKVLPVDLPKYSRALQNSDEVRLLVAIFRSQGKYKEALEILDGPQIGLVLKICAKSWELVLEKLELYALCELWEDQWRFCYNILLEAHGDDSFTPKANYRVGFGRFGDDWQIWEGLLAAAAKIDDTEYVLQVFVTQT